MMMTLFDEEQVMRAYVESERKEAAKKAAVISAIEIYQEMGKTNSFYTRYRKGTWRHLLAYKHLIAPYPK